jgi:hypothetical protein
MFYRSSIRSAALSVVFSLVLAASASADPTKEQCIDANTRAQSLLRAHSLAEARALLQSCVDPQCPTPVRIDCSRRLEVLDRMQPTIIFDAKDEAGNDLSGVSVNMDGRSLTERLDGAELSVDPGSHDFVFKAAGRAPVKQSYVLKEFEKGRRELVIIPLGAGPLSQPPRKLGTSTLNPTGSGEPERANREADGASAPRPAPVAVVRPVPISVYFLGGIAAAGLIDFAIAGTLGNSLKSELESSGCSPFCDRDKVSAMRSRYLVADLGLAVGIAGLAGAAVALLTRPGQQIGQIRTRSRASAEWLATPLRSGASIAWRTSF